MHVLVLGGSQGASALNRAVVHLLPSIVDSHRAIRFTHQTGAADYEWVKRAYEKSGVTGHVSAFLEDMETAYAEADLVVSRSGASTVAEIIETATPAILVPYPFAADDHQRHNALSVVKTGGAELMPNGELDERLWERLTFHQDHPEERTEMSAALSSIRDVPAALKIAEECRILAGEKCVSEPA